MRIVVIGGVAAGMSAASQARRRHPQAEVIVFERGPYVSYGACGMPYNIAEPARDMRDLIVISAARLRSERGIDVRLQHEALAIDTAVKQVTVRDLRAGQEYRQPYDKLVIATGARVVNPHLPGSDLPGVFMLRELTDGEALKARLAQTDATRALIIGAGYIGMEMAEAFRRRGLEVSMLERAPQVLPGFAPVIAALAEDTLHENGVEVLLGISVQAITRAGETLHVQTDQGNRRADIVLIAVGIRPNVQLAGNAGILLGQTGAISVDETQRTDAPDVFAAGDCCETWHRVLDRPVWIPLGTTANKQGKVAGANAVGGSETFSGIVGTAGFRLFDLEVARTGLGAPEIARHGIQATQTTSHHSSRERHIPGGERLTTVLYAERGSGRLLGAQMAGRDVVAKRIDVFATALAADMTLKDIESLDLAYAPPIAPVYDPILVAAAAARREHGEP